jgi:hypothetical protein
MKIRNGFVSNSSSSSFLIYGAAITQDDAETFEKKAVKAGLEFKYGPDGYDNNYIGLSWDSIKDNETGKEFKERIEKAVEKVMGEKTDCGTHSEAWYNG